MVSALGATQVFHFKSGQMVSQCIGGGMSELRAAFGSRVEGWIDSLERSRKCFRLEPGEKVHYI